MTITKTQASAILDADATLITNPASPAPGESYTIRVNPALISGLQSATADAQATADAAATSATAALSAAETAEGNALAATLTANEALAQIVSAQLSLGPTVSLDLYVSAAGDDNMGDGSELSPFATLARVNQEHLSYLRIAQSVVRLVGAGPFVSCAFSAAPFAGRGRLIVWGQGFTTLTGTLTLAEVNGGGQFLKLTTSPGALDSYIRKTLEITSGPCAGFRRTLRGHQTKLPCDFATTANIALTGSLTVDGQASGDHKRALVKNQTNPLENGIYSTRSGGAWVRAYDSDYRAKINDAAVTILAGTVNAGTTWYQTTYSPVPGTTAQTWSQTDVVLSPLLGVQSSTNAVPAAGNTCVIKEPLATIVTSFDGEESEMFVHFPRQEETNVNFGAHLVNVKLDSSDPNEGYLVVADGSLSVYGIDTGANAGIFLSKANLISGIFNFTLHPWMVSVFGLADPYQWYGWGCGAAVGNTPVSQGIGFCELQGFFVFGAAYSQGTGLQTAAEFWGARIEGGIVAKQGDLVISNSLVLGHLGIIGADNSRLVLFEDLASIAGQSNLVSNCDFIALSSRDNALVFVRSGALAAHGAVYGMNVADDGSFAGGGTISLQLAPDNIKGDTADVHLHKGDYSIGYFDAPSKGAVDDVEPYATGGRVRRVA